MKKLIAILAIYISSVASGQTKIDGIGNYKINRSLISAIDTMELSEVPAEVTLDSNDVDNTDGPYDKNHKIFKLAKLVLSSLVLKDITLEYYRDTLFSIYIHGYDKNFEEALTAKYGQPKVVTKSKIINCLYQLTGAKFKKEEVSWTKYYRKDKIEASTYLSKDYDDKCQPTYFEGFFIYDTAKQKTIITSERINKAKFDQVQNDKRKRRLLSSNKDL